MIKYIIEVLLVISAIVISALLWLFLPTGENTVWKWISVVVACVFIGIFASVWYIRERQKIKNNEKVDKDLLYKEDSKMIRKLFAVAVKKILGRSNIKIGNMYVLPWYIALGAKNDGKSTFLEKNGFEKLTDRKIKNLDSNDFMTFWVNDDAVVIEIGNRIFDEKGLDDILWKILIKQLLKYRPRQGLNGILTLVGCDRLLDADRTDRHAIASHYQDAILIINRQLQIELPVYTIFSKADSIADFISYFKSFSSEDLENPLGVTFSCTENKQINRDEFNRLSKNLLNGLVKQQFSLLNDLSIKSTSSIITFPYQLDIFFDIISDFIFTVSKNNRVRESIWIRGFYLVSSCQSGVQYDLLSQIVSEKGDFNSQTISNQVSDRGTYFTSQVFADVILLEKKITGINQVNHVSYLASRTVILLLLFWSFAVFIFVLKDNWTKDETWRYQAMKQFDIYRDEIAFLPNQFTILDTVPIFDSLRTVLLKGKEHKPWYQRVSLNQGEVAQQAFEAYQKQLSLTLLPKFQNQLTKELSIYVELGNSSKVFEILRYYLMLFDKKQLNELELKEYLLEGIKAQGSASSHDLSVLSNLMDDLFSSNYSILLEPDKELIAKATNELDGLSPERLIYATIKSLPQYRTQVDLRRQLGDNFDYMFTFAVDSQGYLLPEMYTKQGYSNIDLSPASSLLRNELVKFKSIQGGNQNVTISEMTALSKNIQRLYFADYIRYWYEFINNIQVKKFDDISELIFALKSSRDPGSSPLLDVLDILVFNTTLAVEEQPDIKGQKRLATQLGVPKAATRILSKVDRINRAVGANIIRLQPSFVVNEAFLPYSNYLMGVNRNGGVTPFDKLSQQFDLLNSYLDIAITSPVPGKSFLQYAKLHASGSKDQIVTFQQFASSGPDPIVKWGKSVVEQTWYFVLEGSKPYIQSQWNERVYQFYQEAIDGRFPFSMQGRGEVSLDDFISFFKPQGRLDSYISDYLMPFVYWDYGILKSNLIDGLSLPLSKTTRTQLQQARKIKETFFGLSGQALALNFAFRAVSMSPNVTEFELKSNGPLFSYSQGPRFWQYIKWPFANQDDPLISNFFIGENRVITESFNGQWALFRGMFKPDNVITNNRFISNLDFVVGDDNIELEYKLTDSNQTIDKKLFTDLSLPKTL